MLVEGYAERCSRSIYHGLSDSCRFGKDAAETDTREDIYIGWPSGSLSIKISK